MWGSLCAVAAASLVAAATSVGYMVLAGTEDDVNILAAAISGDSEAIQVLMFVAIPAIGFAAATATIATIAIVFSMYARAQHGFWTSFNAYALVGLGAAVVLISLVMAVHFLWGWLTPGDVTFVVVSLLFGGPIASASFWAASRPDRTAW
jgi:hypothetical protein